MIISQLMDATLREANAIYAEKEQLQLEVNQLGETIKRQNDMIRAADGMAEENMKLRQTCETLIAKNSKLEEDEYASQAKLQSLEAEIAALKENHG